MKNVALIGLTNISNAGDDILSDTTEYLLHSIEKINVKRVEFQPTNKELLAKA